MSALGLLLAAVVNLIVAIRNLQASRRLTEQQTKIDEVDRNARAYGWEVGQGRPMVERLEATDPANPFLAKDWRDQIEAQS